MKICIYGAGAIGGYIGVMRKRSANARSTKRASINPHIFG
jgi:ketopantoate reductase